MIKLTDNDGLAYYVYLALKRKEIPVEVSKTTLTVEIYRGAKTMSIPRGLRNMAGKYYKFYVNGRSCNNDREYDTTSLNTAVSLAEEFFGTA